MRQEYIPIKHIEIGVIRKPGDGGWIGSSVASIVSLYIY